MTTDNKERQMFEMQLREIDLRRAVIENLLSGMPRDADCDGCCDRQELEAEMRSLWIARVEVARKLTLLRGIRPPPWGREPLRPSFTGTRKPDSLLHSNPQRFPYVLMKQ